MSQPRFHKPLPMPDMDPLDTAPDPAARTELAHSTAALLISPHRDSSTDPDRDDAATARFVHLAEEFGLEAIAEVWASAPAVSLPGSLWRLYAIREWIRRSPRQVADWFSSGRDGRTAPEVIAGIASPPGPGEVARAADEILAGAFRGDYAIALARAAAFITVTARGRRVESRADASGAEDFERLADDLAAAARAYTQGRLD
ncbi:hypothetical protein ACH0BO_06660 [Brevibacterium luteolum]|uniref:hypothetical protein n=1 Tax=Brevibacterium luteolum TaxID=199591 RepID=UPI00387A0412